MKSSEILRKSEDLTIYWGFIMQYSDWNPDQTNQRSKDPTESWTM